MAQLTDAQRQALQALKITLTSSSAAEPKDPPAVRRKAQLTDALFKLRFDTIRLLFPVNTQRGGFVRPKILKEAQSRLLTMPPAVEYANQAIDHFLAQLSTATFKFQRLAHSCTLQEEYERNDRRRQKLGTTYYEEQVDQLRTLAQKAHSKAKEDEELEKETELRDLTTGLVGKIVERLLPDKDSNELIDALYALYSDIEFKSRFPIRTQEFMQKAIIEYVASLSHYSLRWRPGDRYTDTDIRARRDKLNLYRPPNIDHQRAFWRQVKAKMAVNWALTELSKKSTASFSVTPKLQRLSSWSFFKYNRNEPRNEPQGKVCKVVREIFDFLYPDQASNSGPPDGPFRR